MANCPYADMDWYCDQQEGHEGPHGMQLFPEPDQPAAKPAAAESAKYPIKVPPTAPPYPVKRIVRKPKGW